MKYFNIIIVGTSCSNDESEAKFENAKFETLRTIDQSSDGIGIERQHSSDHVITIYYIIVYFRF